MYVHYCKPLHRIVFFQTQEHYTVQPSRLNNETTSVSKHTYRYLMHELIIPLSILLLHCIKKSILFTCMYTIINPTSNFILLDTGELHSSTIHAQEQDISVADTSKSVVPSTSIITTPSSTVLSGTNSLHY